MWKVSTINEALQGPLVRLSNRSPERSPWKIVVFCSVAIGTPENSERTVKGFPKPRNGVLRKEPDKTTCPPWRNADRFQPIAPSTATNLRSTMAHPPGKSASRTFLDHTARPASRLASWRWLGGRAIRRQRPATRPAAPVRRSTPRPRPRHRRLGPTSRSCSSRDRGDGQGRREMSASIPV